MSRVEKAAEPSMEEILASIRKIISEEPASPRSAMPAAPPVSAPTPRQEAPTPRQEALGLRAETSAASAASGALASLAAAGNPRKASPSAAAVDDVLDALSNDIPTRPNVAAKPLAASLPAPTVTVPPQASAAPATPTTPAVPLEAPPWLTQKPQGSVTTGDKRPMPAAPAPSLPVRETPRPFFADAPANLPSPAAAAQPLNAIAPAGEPLRRPQTDLGAVVPARSESAQGPSLTMPAAGPARPVPGGPREELLIVPHTTVGHSAANGHLNGASHREPATDTRLADPPRPATSAPASAEPTGGGRSEPIPHSRVVAAMTPAATGLNGSAPAAKHAEAEAKAEVDPKAEAKPASALNGAGPAPNGIAPKSAAAAAARPANAADSPAKSAPVAPAGAPAPSAPAAALAPLAPVAPVGAQPIRTMEDTVAELLRPMLRQWLDANMPRIVEKALRVELAESAKKKH